ncbi:MAG: hypothetical protein HQK49_02420 [Oligoflexia bacterium]|nr:hypothetical protein [Oligoflexia bacterium]
MFFFYIILFIFSVYINGEHIILMASESVNDLSTVENEMFKASTSNANNSISLESEAKESMTDKLTFGGEYSFEAITSLQKNKNIEDGLFKNPNTLELYLDAKVKEWARVFSRGTLVYDPSVNESAVNIYTGRTYKKTETTLSELKFMGNFRKKVFITLGKQKIKHGSAKFWNPSDFLNNTARDFFELLVDKRGGIPLVKFHLPIENANIYLISIFDNTNNTNKNIGEYLRIEQPFSSSELSMSFFFKKNQRTKISMDFSTDVYDFDFYLESALSHGSDNGIYKSTNTLDYLDYKDDEWIYSGTAGLEYQRKYHDNHTVTAGLEYFYNGEGVDDKKLYPYLIINRRYIPYRSARHYGMFLIYLPSINIGIGETNDYNLYLFNLANLMDSSFIFRPELSKSIDKDISLSSYLGLHYGKSDGEFMMGNQLLDIGIKLVIKI